MGQAQRSSQEEVARERRRVEELLCNLDTMKAELTEARAVGSRECEMSNGTGVSSEHNGAADSSEVQLLRSELAKRDRELLSAAAARRRAADQSERAAATLRA